MDLSGRDFVGHHGHGVGLEHWAEQSRAAMSARLDEQAILGIGSVASFKVNRSFAECSIMKI
jgi:hypothetical protein